MEKIKLLSDEHLKFGELIFDINQFELPKQFHVDFSKLREGFKYDTINGENVKTDELTHFTLPAYDSSMVKILTEAGQDYTQMKSYEIVIDNNLETVKQLAEENYVGCVKFQSLSAKPKWVSNSYRGVKLVGNNVQKSG